MTRVFAVLLLSGCQVANVGERLFACDADGHCPDGFECSVDDGLCLRVGELCTSNITVDRDAGGAFEVTLEGDLSLYAHDQDSTFCSVTPKGADVFYGFSGAGPFSATVTPVGNWKPVVTLQKCDVTASANRCGETSVSDPELDPGYWRVGVSSATATGGAFSVRIRAAALQSGDYCNASVRLSFVAGADGGLTATTRFDSSLLVPWTQGLWGCGATSQAHDAVFFAPGRDGGRVTARTSAPFRHWVQWRAGNDSCFAATVAGCTEALNQGDGGWRATLAGPTLTGSGAWLWVGGGDGGAYDLQVDLR